MAIQGTKKIRFEDERSLIWNMVDKMAPKVLGSVGPCRVQAWANPRANALYEYLRITNVKDNDKTQQYLV